MATARHENKTSTRVSTRKKARKEERKSKFREWSANRPKVEDVDLTEVQLAAQLVKDGSGWEQADKTGLCTSTIYRFRNGDVRYPRFTTLQMIAKANGGRMRFVRDN